MESNTFKTTEPLFAPREAVRFYAAVAGLVAVVVAFAVDPFGPPAVLTSWALFLGGLVLALAPASTRSLGVGLAFAGAALPLAAFFWFWVVASAWMLDGSLT